MSLIVLVVIVSGCGRSLPGVGTGSLKFSVDLSQLGRVQSTAVAATASTITKVTVTVSRTGYDSIITDLTVVDNVATGQVDNLASGYWHVDAAAYEGTTLLFSGGADAEVIAGVVTQCTILFEPNIQEPTTGGISITVGLNPLPGYKVIDQAVSRILVDGSSSKVYILDSTTNKIGVYDADTLIRERDIVLDQAPLSIAFNADKTSVFLGYSTGNVFSLNISTGAITRIGDVLMPVTQMVAFGSSFLLVNDSSYLKTLNINTGQVVDSVDSWYTPHSLELNKVDSTVYFYRINVTPDDVHRVRFNATTGDIISVTDSPYHGDYTLGPPLRVINDGTRVVTSSGSMFTCSSVDSEDLLYAGNLGYSYIDLISDDARGYLYALGNQAIKKLLVLNQSNFFLVVSVELKGNPKYIFHTNQSVLAFVEYQGKYYAKVWSKAGLGI